MGPDSRNGESGGARRWGHMMVEAANSAKIKTGDWGGQTGILFFLVDLGKMDHWLWRKVLGSHLGVGIHRKKKIGRGS